MQVEHQKNYENINSGGNRKEKYELSKFSILPENGPSQMLQVNLVPFESFYYIGKILYSDYTQKSLSYVFRQHYWNFLNIGKPRLNQWTNKSNKLQIVGLKHQIKGGSILILDLNVYKQNLFISTNHLLASTNNIFTSQIDFHKQINNFCLLKYKNLSLDNLQDYFQKQQLAVLQSNTPIIEKYLGQNQQFNIYQSFNVLAFSESVTVDQIDMNGAAGFLDRRKIIKFKGPGWIFFDADIAMQPISSSKNLGSLLLTIFLFFMILFV